jgi:hypothetical protein
MGLHDPFGHLKHKSWPKEKSGVKLVVWLLTTKSWESTWFSCVQVHASYNFASDLISIRGLHTKLWGPKSQESQFWEFWDSHLGVSGQNAIWMWASWRGTEYTIRGKVVASPKSGLWWVLWVRICSWLVLVF